jgi:hypothetical protein
VRWLVLLALFALAILAGIVVARGAVVAIWPPAARLYALAGLPAGPLGAGLKIANVAPARTPDGLMIRETCQPGKTARDVRVAARAMPLEGSTIQVIGPPTPQLQAGAVALQNPFEHPRCSHGVVVTFVTR